VNGPSRVEFTNYAEGRAIRRGLSARQIADLVLDQHQRRRRNPRQADWVLSGRGLGVAYNWPDRGDRTTALVVTVWSE